MSQFYKVAVLGAGGVGKSDLVLRFTQNRFEEFYDPTIEDQYTHNFELDGKAVKLEILDTAGQEDFSNLLENYVSTREAYIISYSIIDFSSMEVAREIAMYILKVRGNATPVGFVGNKSDLYSDRQVEKGIFDELSKCFSYSFCIETSAKESLNVKEAFFELTRLVWKRNLDKNLAIGYSEVEVKLNSSETSEQPRGKCCRKCVIY